MVSVVVWTTPGNLHLTGHSEEVMIAGEPESFTPKGAPIFLVREDGQCIVPTNITYR